MYIALNPQKVRHFTTKGIHLTLLKPIGFVPTDLEDEFRFKIDEAIRNQELIVIPDSEAAGIIIPGIGSSSGVSLEEETKGQYAVGRKNADDKVQEVKDMFGTVRRTRKIMYTLTLPKDPEADQKPLVIITDRG